MSDENLSEFELERDGVRVELTGNWRFVQEMGRRVMRDVGRGSSEETEERASSTNHRRKHVLWIIRYGELMRRIYMASPRDFAKSPLAGALDPDAIGTLHIDKSAFDELLPAVASGEKTIWAKLTEAGRRELEDADH
jgi:hypothetical protein